MAQNSLTNIVNHVISVRRKVEMSNFMEHFSNTTVLINETKMFI